MIFKQARGALLCILPCFAACVVPNSKIEGDDRADLLPAGRLSFDLLNRRAAPAPDPNVPRRNEFKLLGELDVSGGRGDFRQRATPTDPVSLGGPQFTNDVEVDFDLFRTSVAVRAANRFRSGIGLDGILGIVRSDLEIKLSDGVTSDSAEHVAYGPVLGVNLSYSPAERLRLFAEGSLNFGFASGVDWITITTIDVGASFSVCSYAQITAGWRRLAYEAELDDFVASDLDLELSGPLLALWINL